MLKYTVKKRIVSVGRDYRVEDESEKLVFQIDGKVRFARTFVLRNDAGTKLLKSREKLLCLDSTFEIKKDDRNLAIVRRRTQRHTVVAKFEVEIPMQTTLKASGNFFYDDSVKIHRDEACIAEVSQQQNTIQEIYYVYVRPEEDQPLMVTIAMSIAEILRSDKPGN